VLFRYFSAWDSSFRTRFAFGAILRGGESAESVALCILHHIVDRVAVNGLFTRGSSFPSSIDPWKSVMKFSRNADSPGKDAALRTTMINPLDPAIRAVHLFRWPILARYYGWDHYYLPLRGKRRYPSTCGRRACYRSTARWWMAEYNSDYTNTATIVTATDTKLAPDCSERARIIQRLEARACVKGRVTEESPPIWENSRCENRPDSTDCTAFWDSWRGAELNAAIKQSRWLLEFTLSGYEVFLVPLFLDARSAAVVIAAGK